MSKTEFDEFVQRQRAKNQEVNEFDSQKQLEEWIDYLNQLYDDISGFMRGYICNGDAEIKFRDINLNEDFIGDYTAKELILIIGRSTIIFKPIATMLIGSKGRVDVQGPRGQVRLSLINKKVSSARQLIRVTVTLPGEPVPASPLIEDVNKIEWAWKIVTPAPEIRFIDLTEEAFFDMILSVADA
jgi:hypothetical protein